ISMECYPAAKSGGLGDVVGALPIYLNRAGISTTVIIPKFQTKWLNQQWFRQVFSGHIKLGNELVWFSIEEVMTDGKLGFPLYVANIPGKFDRPGVYSDPVGGWYGDETERHLCFQQAVLKWVVSMHWKPEILHCHDHHTGLIPFMVKYCPEFESLRRMPTVFTIHNGAYHGSFSWSRMALLPMFQAAARGLLDWADTICPLAAGIKNSWQWTTVSPGYLEELRYDSNGMEWLMNHELPKAQGIINGIDAELWNPATDLLIAHKLENGDVESFKQKNRAVLLDRFRIIPDLPIVTFIGRLVGEKGGDLIAEAVRRALNNGSRFGFIVLGTGEPEIMDAIRPLRNQLSGHFDAALEYNEALAHQLYAGSDFLFMPSRVEPCGLNQMYACRYGTVPIVRSVGGLKDTIPDIGENGGRGIRFNHFSGDDAALAVYRATRVYANQEVFGNLRKRIMAVDFSWERSAGAYIRMYNELS
ncbi:MAG: glycogen/starch synthase, partial [Bacteroidota bacterium]